MNAPLCWGCRIQAGMPTTPSDLFPVTTPDGMTWKIMECPRYGVDDVHLVPKDEG